MCDYDIIPDNKANTLIVLYETARCWHVSLEGAAFLSGSQVRLSFILCYLFLFVYVHMLLFVMANIVLVN